MLGRSACSPDQFLHNSAGFNGRMDDYNDVSDRQFTEEQINGFNIDYDTTRSMRIRAALFPETCDDSNFSMTGEGSAFDLGRSTNVQLLSVPGQMLKVALINLLNYQDDAERTFRAIPELIRLLNDKDTVTAGKAAKLVKLLSYSDAMCKVMIDNERLVETVSKIASGDAPNAEMTHNAVVTLHNMSKHSKGLHAIFRSGGIQALLKMLECPDRSIVGYAIEILYDLTVHQAQCKETIRKLNGVKRIANVLTTQRQASCQLLAFVTESLYHLTIQHQQSKDNLLQSNALNELIYILKSPNNNYTKLTWSISRLTLCLSSSPENKDSLLNAGLLNTMCHMLNQQEERTGRGKDDEVWQRIMHCTCLTLRNLSDVASKRDDDTQMVITQLLRIVNCSNQQPISVVTCLVQILANLTCDNVRNKATFCRNGGVSVTLNALEKWCAYDPTSGNGTSVERSNVGQLTDEMVDASLCLLRHVTSRQPDVEMTCNEFRLYKLSRLILRTNAFQTPLNGLHLIVEFLNADRPSTVVKPALGLITNLCHLPANNQIFAETSCVDLTCLHLQHSFQQMRLFQNGQSIRNSKLNNLEPDVIPHMQLIESSLSALHWLCKLVQSRGHVYKNTSVVPILVQLLYVDVEQIQCYSAAVLSELVEDVEGFDLIEQHGAVPQLTELLHSKNEKISTYSAAILRALARNKPAEYQQHLGVELTSSLIRDSTENWDKETSNNLPNLHENLFDLYGGDYASEPPAYTTHHVPSLSRPGHHNSGGPLPDWYDTNL